MTIADIKQFDKGFSYRTETLLKTFPILPTYLLLYDKTLLSGKVHR